MEWYMKGSSGHTDYRADPGDGSERQNGCSAAENTAANPSLVSEGEYHQVIHKFKDTGALHRQNCVVHELFEEQVRRNPNAIAVVHDHRSLTYAELNGRGNQLARYLKNRSVTPDQPVGICVSRSPEMVMGLLGILKSGGAYLPLDPS